MIYFEFKTQDTYTIHIPHEFSFSLFDLKFALIRHGLPTPLEFADILKSRISGKYQKFATKHSVIWLKIIFTCVWWVWLGLFLPPYKNICNEQWCISIKFSFLLFLFFTELDKCDPWTRYGLQPEPRLLFVTTSCAESSPPLQVSHRSTV